MFEESRPTTQIASELAGPWLVSELIERLFGVTYTLRGVSYLLHRMGYSLQVPGRLDLLPGRGRPDPTTATLTNMGPARPHATTSHSSTRPTSASGRRSCWSGTTSTPTSADGCTR